MWRRYLKVSLPVQIFALILLAYFGIDEIRHTFIILLNLQGIGFLVDTYLFDVGSNLSQTWFITVILICYSITPWLGNLIYNRRLDHFSIIIIWLFTLILPYVGLHIENISLYITSFYFAATNKLIRFKMSILCVIMIIAAVLRIAGRYFFDGTILYNSTICTISMTLIAVSIMLLIRELSLRKDNFNCKAKWELYKYVEKYSFYIYITHYCLIPITYQKYGITLATIQFTLYVIFLSFVLERLHYITVRGVTLLSSKLGING